jgi:uroporphyrinogen-III synthase
VTAAQPVDETAQGGELSGFVVILTCERRAADISGSFTRRGATVLHAPTLRILPLAEEDLVAVTRALIRRPPDDVIVTTAIGFRNWVESADACGLAPHLLDVLSESRILARGPKARGAIRAAGLVETWAALSETTAEVVEFLLAEGVAARRIAVQLHGATDMRLLDRLAAAGAEVLPVPVYRWGPPVDPAAVRRAVDLACQRAADAVLFTSAPGAEAFLAAARSTGQLDDLVGALRTDVTAAAVGPVTARPLRDAGVLPLVPDRSRLGALVRITGQHLLANRVRELRTRFGELHLRGQAAFLDGRPLTLPPAPMATLRALARRPGHVVDRSTLLAALPEATDPHAVEVTVARLRRALGEPRLVETVVKRGYRLAMADGPADRPTDGAAGR